MTRFILAMTIGFAATATQAQTQIQLSGFRCAAFITFATTPDQLNAESRLVVAAVIGSMTALGKGDAQTVRAALSKVCETNAYMTLDDAIYDAFGTKK